MACHVASEGARHISVDHLARAENPLRVRALTRRDEGATPVSDKSNPPAWLYVALAPLLAWILFPISLYIACSAWFVMAKLWAWYAVPLGYATVGWKTFAAAALFLGLLRFKAPSAEPKDERETSAKVAGWIGWTLSPWWVLLVAWVIR